MKTYFENAFITVTENNENSFTLTEMDGTTTDYMKKDIDNAITAVL